MHATDCNGTTMFIEILSPYTDDSTMIIDNIDSNTDIASRFFATNRMPKKQKTRFWCQITTTKSVFR